jgi:hypothetical protein
VTRFLCLLLLLPAANAFAQRREPIPRFVFDTHVVFPNLKQNVVTATTLDTTPDNLPARGMGFRWGAQVYPIRKGGFALGAGAELLLSRASHQETNALGKPVGLKIDRRLQSFSGQLSLNFGKREGWSYLSVGMGPLAFDTFVSGNEPDGLREMTPNYGGGARWFNYDHLAFSLDLRFYATRPANATTIVGARERQTVVVMSAGVSIK